MKRIINVIILLLSVSLYGQTTNKTEEWHFDTWTNLSNIEYKEKLNFYDFCNLWTVTENSNVYGFIDIPFQRIRIKILSATRSKNNRNIYNISGKSKVKNRICTFQGTITISSIKTYDIMHWGVDNEYKGTGIKKQGLLVATYYFKEDRNYLHSGTFEGTLYSLWYLDKLGKIRYDKIESNSDNYRNNQFIGLWRDYVTKEKKACCWGDFRIPASGDLDIGEGEFSPAKKYLKFGWQTYHDAYSNNNKSARQEEEIKWWK